MNGLLTLFILFNAEKAIKPPWCNCGTPTILRFSYGGRHNPCRSINSNVNKMTKARPGGVTPLTDRVDEIFSDVGALRESLEMEGKRVSVFLDTDGLPTDSQGVSDEYNKQIFIQSLRRLEGLPVWLVIRLCTDDKQVVVSDISSKYLYPLRHLKKYINVIQTP